MSPDQLRLIEYHERRRGQERERAHAARCDRARAAHLQLAQLHDVQRICSYVLAPATL